MSRTIDVTREQTLTEINLADALEALGAERYTLIGRAVAELLRPAARKFARQILQFDRWVAEMGLHRAAREFIAAYVKQVEVNGTTWVPQQGPLLVVVNHPGLSDALALFTALPRDDLRVLAADRPFLDTLPAIKSYLISVPVNQVSRMPVIRQAVGHLRSGGTLVNFQAGRIEPDPAVLPGALESLNTWSESIGVFVRAVPEVTVLPIVVSGVLSPAALRHPLTRLRKMPRDRERVAATLWIMMKLHWPERWPVRVRVDILPPLEGLSLVELHEVTAITRAVIAHVRSHFPYL